MAGAAAAGAASSLGMPRSQTYVISVRMMSTILQRKGTQTLAFIIAYLGCQAAVKDAIACCSALPKSCKNSQAGTSLWPGMQA